MTLPEEEMQVASSPTAPLENYAVVVEGGGGRAREGRRVNSMYEEAVSRPVQESIPLCLPQQSFPSLRHSSSSGIESNACV